MRLVGGSDQNEGRVEVYYENEWGTVCDYGWDDKDARVVCHQLGLPTANAEALSSAHFGPGLGRILLDNVRCNGRESSLNECEHIGWGNHYCDHHKDSSVKCLQGRYNWFWCKTDNGTNPLKPIYCLLMGVWDW